MRPTQTAFVGDIHGNLAALNGLAELLLNDPTVGKIVFLGDYIDKGADPAGVVSKLIDLAGAIPLVALRGNHEEELLEALHSGNLATFLKKGGATTIRSYLRRPATPDVASDFRRAVPNEHLQFLNSMPLLYQTPEIVASHRPLDSKDTRFQVSAHIPVGDLPVIDQKSAKLDTDCGTSSGRLTAFFWPSRGCIQVDSSGQPIQI